MLLAMCKSCQYCLESIYWKCCEERFCFDEKLAACTLEDVNYNHATSYVNMGASLDSVRAITTQPLNNNNNTSNNNTATQHQNNRRATAARQLNEIPINADKIYQVFSKSMIFREDPELRKSIGSQDSLDELETKSEPDYLDRPNRTKVYFEDEINSPITDFEIMFKDELLSLDSEKTGMFKIDEDEDEEIEEEGGLIMNIKKPGHDLIKTSSITLKEQAKITTPNPIYEYDPTKSVSVSTISIPKVENVKSILRVNKDLPRSNSAKNLIRLESSTSLKMAKINRVESLKNMETKNINKVLSRVPFRSASFLNLPDHLQPEVKCIKKSDSELIIRNKTDSEFLVSRLPDTPLIKSANLPKFFAESPALGEYKAETSLQSIKQKDNMVFTENDYRMPRYYGITPTVIETVPVHESKSMPDLRAPRSNAKVSKRLVKLRSKLKPLVIMKGTDDKV